MEEKRGRGYDGKSMSMNARSAYGNGENPLSKWTKSAILEAIKDEAEEKLELVGKLTAAELKQYFLRRIRAEKITEKREELRRMWEKQVPEKLVLLDNDDFVESYIR